MRRLNKWHYFIDGLIILLILLLLASIGFAFFGLPRTDNLENLQLKSATQVFDSNGQLISKLFEENRIVITISHMPIELQNAVVANEDVRFYKHLGVDPIGIMRAVFVNIRNGSIVEGGSTITQQLAKNMFLTQEQTAIRKIKEAMLALIIEAKFSKQEILQAYLNQVYLGEGAYGVEAAAQLYFGKHAQDLTLAESAMIAGILRGPSIYSPYSDTKAALDRRAVVLNGMAKAGYITPEEAQKASAEPLYLAGKKKRVAQASYFTDYIANELVGRYGANRVYRGGLKVYTTLDLRTQQAAEGVLGNYQGAVIGIDPRNGYIRAMVGGKNYEESQINRVIAEVRQPGSAFKPFVYATAINQGITPAYVVVDDPININGYAPKNYDKKYNGPVTLKKALRLSINVPAVKLGQQVGIANVLTMAQSLGISTIVPDDNNLATALGGLTHGVNLIELTTAYTAFANAGVVSKPIAILRVLDENNQVLEEQQISQRAVLSPELAYIITDMLKGSLINGTATAANIGKPAAGKTGTTDNYETAWFIGYTPELVVGIYVGNDNRKPVGISGSEVAAFWGKMMTQLPVANIDFAVPQTIITGVPICADSGKRAIVDKNSPIEYDYCAFLRGTEPKEVDPRFNVQESKTEQKQSLLPKLRELLPRLPGF